MFDISWSELLILGVVTVVFVGPKDLPVLMRTLGKYLGVVNRYKNEFKSRFDEAMSEAQLDLINKEVDYIRTSVESANEVASPDCLDSPGVPVINDTLVDAEPTGPPPDRNFTGLTSG
jgi:sec-independent protein translocase protein TatB